MAKFVVTLCILLIAFAFGDEDSSSSGIMDKITSALTSYGTEGQKSMQSILESIINATKSAAAFNNRVNRTIENATAQYKAMVASIASNGTGNVSSCTSLSSIRFENLASKVASNTIDCGHDTLAEILSGSNQTVAGFKESTISLTDIAKNAASCASNNDTASSCITPIWTTVTNGTAIIWAKLVADAAILTARLATIEVSLGSCGFIGATRTLASEAEASYSEIRKCINDLNSTSS